MSNQQPKRQPAASSRAIEQKINSAIRQAIAAERKLQETPSALSRNSQMAYMQMCMPHNFYQRPVPWPDGSQSDRVIFSKQTDLEITVTASTTWGLFINASPYGLYSAYTDDVQTAGASLFHPDSATNATIMSKARCIGLCAHFVNTTAIGSQKGLITIIPVRNQVSEPAASYNTTAKVRAWRTREVVEATNSFGVHAYPQDAPTMQTFSGLNSVRDPSIVWGLYFLGTGFALNDTVLLRIFHIYEGLPILSSLGVSRVASAPDHEKILPLISSKRSIMIPGTLKRNAALVPVQF